MNFLLAHPLAFLARINQPRTRTAACRPARTAPAAGDVRTLEKGSFLAVDQRNQATVSCLTGCLWITHDNQPADIIVAAGESYTRQSDSRMLVFALEAASAVVR